MEVKACIFVWDFASAAVEEFCIIDANGFRLQEFLGKKEICKNEL